MKGRRIAILLLLAALAAAACAAGLLIFRSVQDNRQYQAELERMNAAKPQTEGADGEAEEDPLAEAKKINPQTVAWLTIPDTVIDYPVLWSGDNSYYLNHNFEGEVSANGAPFLDYRCASDFSDFYSIIYGHHLKGGRMFSGLTKFQDEDYFDSHSFGYLVTEEGRYTLRFIACLNVKNDSFVYQTVFLTDEEKENFLDGIREQAVCRIDFENADMLDQRLVALSTCSYEFTDARTVLVGYLEE